LIYLSFQLRERDRQSRQWTGNNEVNTLREVRRDRIRELRSVCLAMEVRDSGSIPSGNQHLSLTNGIDQTRRRYCRKEQQTAQRSGR
jgi:hypothetical protein